jgi:uncharacterized protein YjiS (DUF1127 family)
MATATIDPRATGRAVLSKLRSAFCEVTSFLSAIAAARRSALEAERLMALSDRQLARLGLTRGEIVQHVFRTDPHD